jgi:hypothetical protein
MLNNKTTHNPNGNIVWSDSPNSIFKLAYLSEEDIKYYCFGDGPDGGDSEAVDFASDMGIASANAPPDAFGAEGDPPSDPEDPPAGWGDPGVPGATTPSEAAQENFGVTHNIPDPEILGFRGKTWSPVETLFDMTDFLGPIGFGLRGLAEMMGMDKYGLNVDNPLSEIAQYGNAIALGTPNAVTGTIAGMGHGVEAAKSAISDAVTSGLSGLGIGTENAPSQTAVQGSTGTDSISAASSPTSDAPSSPTSDALGDGGDSISRGLASIIPQPPTIGSDPINPSTVNQPVSTISRSVRQPNQPLTVEEALSRARLGGGFNTRQAGGLVSLGNTKRTNPVFAQSGGNIGGLMNTGPNVIDVINRGMAMPDNIGAVQMQEKIDINQSTPYTSR